MNKIIVAKIVSTKGLKGEVKVKSFLDDPFSFDSYDLYLEDNTKLELQSFYLHKNIIIASFKGIDTIDKAKDLINMEILIDKAQLPNLDDEDDFYQIDLIGVKVLQNHKIIGKVIAVHNFGSTDLIEVKFNEGSKETILVPFTKHNFPDINLKDGLITMANQEFLEE